MNILLVIFRLSDSLFVCHSVYLNVDLTVYRFVGLFFCLSICQSIFHLEEVGDCRSDGSVGVFNGESEFGEQEGSVMRVLRAKECCLSGQHLEATSHV